MTEKKINDFGFTAHEEQFELPTEVTVPADTSELEAQMEEMRTMIAGLDSGDGIKLRQLEEIITPLLNGLIETADKDWIHWPNRKPILEAKLQEILRITRG